jgi:hypothetical protein
MSDEKAIETSASLLHNEKEFENIFNSDDLLNIKSESPKDIEIVDGKENNEEPVEIKVDSPTRSITSVKSNHSSFSSIRNKIINEIIAPSYFNDVKGTMSARKKWRSASNKIETASKILAGASTIVAFASGVYQYQYLAFIAGCLGTIGIVSQQFATYAMKESQERTEQANKILKTLNINEVDDLGGDSNE